MRGWAQWHRPFSAANLQEAQRSFEQALALDPQSIEARIGLAEVLIDIIAPGWSNSVKQDEARAEQLLLEARGQDQNNSMAHYAMGRLRQMQNRMAEALTEFEAAVALDHNNPWARLLVGGMLRWLGRPQEGIPYIESAIRLTPHDPNISAFYWTLGHSHLVLGHVDQAIDLLRKCIATNTSAWYCHQNLAGALGLRGDLDEARAELAESLRLKPDMNSFAAWRAATPYMTNPDYWALAEKTVNLGLRRAGFPDE